MRNVIHPERVGIGFERLQGCIYGRMAMEIRIAQQSDKHQIAYDSKTKTESYGKQDQRQTAIRTVPSIPSVS